MNAKPGQVQALDHDLLEASKFSAILSTSTLFPGKAAVSLTLHFHLLEGNKNHIDSLVQEPMEDDIDNLEFS